MTAALLTCCCLAFAAPDSTLNAAHTQQLNGYLNAGQFQDAMQLLDRMEQDAAQQPDDFWRFYVRWKRAWRLSQMGDSDGPQRALEAVIGDATKRYGPRFGFLPLMHYDLGELYLGSHKLEKAQDHLDAAIAFVRAGPGTVGTDKTPIPVDDAVRLRMEYLKVQCRVFLGKQNEDAAKENDQLQRKLDDLLETRRTNHAPADQIAACSALAVELMMQRCELYRRNGDMPHAVGGLQQCLDALKSDQSYRALDVHFRCRILLANCYWEIARFRDAAEELEQAGKLPAASGILNARDLAAARTNQREERIQAELDSQLGDPNLLQQLREAETIARDALDKAKQADSGPNPFTSIAYSNLAQIRGMRGRVLEAMGKQQEAHEAFDDALQACDHALDLPDSIFPKDQDLFLHIRRCRAWVNLQRGDVDAARKEAAEALALFSRVHKADDVDGGLFYSLLLEIEEQAGDLQAAAAYADKHRRLAASRLPYLVGLTSPEQLRFFQDYDEPALHGGLRLGLADGSPQSIKDLSAEWLINGKGNIGEAAAWVYQQKRKGADAAEFQDLVRRQACLLWGRNPADPGVLDRLEELEAKKRTLAVKQAADLAAPPGAAGLNRWVELGQVQARLRPDEVFIDVCRLRPHVNAAAVYAAWVVTANSPVTVVNLGDADQIDRWVDNLQCHLERCESREHDGYFDTDGAIADEKALRKLYLQPLSDRLLQPLLQAAGDKRVRWIVSPDGDLWNLSWAALILPDGRYAVEQCSFRYVISGRDLVKKDDATAQAGASWLFGNPAFDEAPIGVKGRRRELFGDPLKSAEEEIKSVAEYLPGTSQIRTGAAATKSVFLNLQSPRVLYLATHGFFSLPNEIRDTGDLRVDPLLCCGVAFAGANFAPDDDADLPGLLTGAEVFAVDLRGTDLVVLSACQTGKGEPSPGQSSADLRHAFHLAGARAVASTLWSVRSDKAKELMLAFMKIYAGRKDADKAEALAQAQRRMIQALHDDPDVGASHPFYWAAFTLSGL